MYSVYDIQEQKLRETLVYIGLGRTGLILFVQATFYLSCHRQTSVKIESRSIDNGHGHNHDEFAIEEARICLARRCCDTRRAVCWLNLPEESVEPPSQNTVRFCIAHSRAKFL